jgi:hypothetical protein
MGEFFVFAVAGMTSLGAYLIGRNVWRLSYRGLQATLSKMFEAIGITLLFFVVNLGVGLATILAARIFASKFVSAYLLDDVSLLGVSLFQGLAFQGWRESREAGRITAHHNDAVSSGVRKNRTPEK